MFFYQSENNKKVLIDNQFSDSKFFTSLITCGSSHIGMTDNIGNGFDVFTVMGYCAHSLEKSNQALDVSEENNAFIEDMPGIHTNRDDV